MKTDLELHLIALFEHDPKVPPFVTLNEVGFPPFIVIRHGGTAFRDTLPSILIILELYTGFSNDDEPDGNVGVIIEHIVERVRYGGRGYIFAITPLRSQRLGEPTRRYDGMNIIVQDSSVI